MTPRPGRALSILIYHRVLARPDPLFPDVPDGRQFGRQLGVLRRCFSVLPLREAARRLREGTLPPRAACITFDDGYADNADVALPLLQEHGLSACFFIASGYLNGGRMWNDCVIERVRHAKGERLDLSAFGLDSFALGSVALRRRAIDAILARLKYLPFERRQAIAAQMYAAGHYPGGPSTMLSNTQLRTLHRSGMEIGAHTLSHPILSAMSDLVARNDIASGKRRLEDLIQSPVTLFAYPNGKAGRDYGPRHVEIVKSSGFEAAVATDPGAARADSDPFQLPRFTPWERDRLRFLLRIGQSRLGA